MFELATSADSAEAVIDAFPEPAGLYLHVPFCSSICPFCPYNKVSYDQELASVYFDALTREVGWYCRFATDPFPSLYIGGGTPTLCIDELGSILEALPVSGERAIEVLPGHATDDKLQRLLEIGINYVSLGVQSFDERMLAYLKRPNTVEENHRAVTLTRKRFDCVDVDLIFDVAFEDESVFLCDLETCFEAEIDQVSTYPLMRFGYTPFGKSRHFPKLEHRMLRAAEELAHRYNYERRSVWTFNRRDSPTYTSITREFYLGCGAGAATYTGRMFLVNHFSLAAYLDKISRDFLPIARGTQMSSLRAASYYLFWQLYTGRLEVRRFESLFPGQYGLKALLGTLRVFRLARRRGDELMLTRRGYDHYHNLERWVTYHFIEPLWANMMREHEHLQNVLPEPSRAERIWLQLAGLEEAAA